VSGRWVADDRRSGEPSGGIQLFCFAHAGGGPSLFRPWRDKLAPDSVVRPVQLPGRESRLDEPPLRRMADLIEPLCAALEPYLSEPYAVFGHSMGAIVAYEVARRFSAGAAPGPACLLVSGRAPRLPPGWRQLHALPDREFLAEVGRLNGIPPEVLGEPDLVSMLLPALRADYELSETYQPAAGASLRCPVTAYLSTSDPDVGEQEMLTWKEVTTGEFSMRVFTGDHFYLKGGRQDVLNAVREDLSPARV
jgi:surfactin synthase thioesterase subunit